MLQLTRVVVGTRCQSRIWPLLALCAIHLLVAGCGPSSSIHDSPSLEKNDYIQSIIPKDSLPILDIKQCWPLSDESQPGGSFTIALADSVRPPNAPVPGNFSERMVFSLLYETLVTVGCDGNLEPGLATQWTCTEDGTTWVFWIRDNAVLWDGTRITASVIKRSWIRNQSIAPARDHVSPWAWLNARSKSVKVLDAQRLAIQLPEPQRDFPLLLTHPATAVALVRPGWRWPVGSGPGRLQASTPRPLPDLKIQPNRHHPQPPLWKNLQFMVKPGLDARDLVALNPDVLVVEDNVSANFFREAPGFLVSPLPWQRLYLLVCSPRQNPEGSQRWTTAKTGLNMTGDFTGIATKPWNHLVYPYTRSLSCPQLTGPIPYANVGKSDSGDVFFEPDKNTLLFCEDDPGSRELAMRLAALGDRGIKAQSTSLVQLNRALELQTPGAFILAIDRHYPSGCLQLASLLGRATWLQQAATSNLGNDLSQNSRIGDLPIVCALTETGIITPLLLTHPYLVHKGNLAGIKLRFDGSLNLSKLGQAQ